MELYKKLKIQNKPASNSYLYTSIISLNLYPRIKSLLRLSIMKRFTCIFFFSIFIFSNCISQNSISGKLIGAEDKSPLIGATIILLNFPDSTINKGTTADIEGSFLIDNISNGNYILKVSFIGYTDHFKNIEMRDASVNLGNISLIQASKTLKSVEIADKAPTAIQKGDTTQYNANSYKTNPDANAEDLITKMSGVTVQDGKVQAHGEEVKKVLVDGKPFFGDDPNAVLKNLPADVIDKIQVFDQQSDQSKFTGVSDGNTSKTINIITKPGMKNGTFGRILAGYGYDNVYKAAGNINFFKGDRRISVIAQSNNINEQNFSSDDLAGVMTSSGGGQAGGMRGGGQSHGGSGNWSGGNNSSNFLVNSKNGITATNAIGVNYSDKWRKKLEISSSYFFNWSDNKAEQSINRNYISHSDSGQVYNENNISNSRNINHRINVKLEWKIDTNNSIIITPKLTLQGNNGANVLSGQNTIGQETLNKLNSDYNSETSSYNFSNDLLYQHKFKKKGRTFSINLINSFNSTDAGSNLYSENYYYMDTISFLSQLDQKASLLKKGNNISTNLVYTEPFGTKSILQISYGNSFNITENEKKTYNYSATDDDYNNLDSTLSNIFTSDYNTQKAGLAYRFNNPKLQLMIGANYQYATLVSRQSFPYNYDISESYTNVLPSAMIRYNFTTKKSLRIMYRTQTTQPAIEQLQNVINNTNPTQLSIGNPDLNQNFENTLFMRYSSSNTEKGTSFFAMIAGTATMDYIGNSTFTASSDTVLGEIFLRRGTQLTRPVNLNGYFNARSFITYGFPLSIIKSNLNINMNAVYSRTPGMVNNIINYSNSINYGGGITIASNISKEIDFTVSSNINLYNVENTLNTKLNTQYYNLNNKLKINYIFLNSFVISTDLNHQYNEGLSEGYNQNYLLWNAGLGYKFLKDHRGEIRFSVNDILAQNTSVNRNTTETYIEDVQTNVLQRFYMITLIYNIKVFKKVITENNTHSGRHE
jgi:hypothetical protein